MTEHVFVFKEAEVPTTEDDRSPWANVHVQSVQPVGWARETLLAGLRSLERIRRETEAAAALLLAALPDDRDATAAHARNTGVSAREARRQRAVAAVVAAVPEAQELLASGRVSAEHVAALKTVLDKPGVGVLARRAIGVPPEQFARDVERFRLDLEQGDDTTARQRALRRLRFFRGSEGMVGLSGLLPPLEGATLKTMLQAIVDARWKALHPERAHELGGHGGDSTEQRMADALLELTGVSAPSGGVADEGHDVDAVHDAGVSPFSLPTPGPTRVHTSKPAVVVVFDIDKYEAELLDHGPIPVTESLFDQTRAQLYLYFKNARGEILKFGRARRDPTFAQRLAVMVRDRHCIFAGCDAPASACDVHHLNEWLLDQGFTDVEVLGLFCHPHHRHLHVENLRAVREPDGSVTILERATGIVVARASPKRWAA